MRLVRSRRSEDCLSDLQLDAILAGEGGAAAVQAADVHAATCERCLERFTSVRREREEFLAKDRPARSPRRVWIATGAVVLALAATLLLWMRRPVDADVTDRMKGSSTFGFYVKHEESVVRGVDTQIVHPGDQLRFVVKSPKKSVAILSVDGAGMVNVYFPDEPRTASVDALQETALDRSTQLDAVLGPETLYAIFCDAPTDLHDVQERLRREPQAVPTLSGCEVRTLTLQKAP